MRQTIHEQAGRLRTQYVTEELNRTAEAYEDMMTRQEFADFLPLIAYAWLDYHSRPGGLCLRATAIPRQRPD